MSKGITELHKKLHSWVKTPKIVFQLSLSNSQLRVLLYLLAGSEGWHPTYKDISKALGGLAIREVQRAVQFLVQEKIIDQIRTGDKRKGTTNIYDLSNTLENMEQYVKRRAGVKQKGRCLLSESESEDPANPDTLSA